MQNGTGEAGDDGAGAAALPAAMPAPANHPLLDELKGKLLASNISGKGTDWFSDP